MDHEKFMRIAIGLSQQNVEQGLGGPFGAVVVKNGEIVAQSANRVVPDCDPTAHAEVAAIRLACQALDTFDLSGCYIYASCEPCPMCLGAIYWARIDKLFYANTKQDAANIGFDDAFIYEELSLKMNDRKIEHEQLLHNEALAVFRLWSKTENKDEY